MTMQDLEERHPKLREIRERGERCDALEALIRDKFTGPDCGVFVPDAAGPAKGCVHADYVTETEPTEAVILDPIFNNLAGCLDHMGIVPSCIVAVAKAQVGDVFVWAVWYN